MSTERDELMADIRAIDGPALLGGDVLADGLIAAGYRKIFDGDCGLSNVKDPDDREAAEAWMRWANLAMNDEIGAIGAMKRMLTEFGYRKPKQVTTVEELDALPVASIVSAGYLTWEKFPDEELTYWMTPGDQRPRAARVIVLPATVLHVGGAE